MESDLLSSGADHAKVAAANPRWSVEDWCRYWELDARKIERRHGIRWERMINCGEGCKCRSLSDATRT